MRVLLADDQPEVRSALRLLLEQEPGVSVIGEAAAADDLLTQAQAIRPDLVLLDWELPAQRANEGVQSLGQQLLPDLRALCPAIAVIALSGRPEARQTAIAAGADGFVSKGDPPERLLAVLRSVGVRGER